MAKTVRVVFAGDTIAPRVGGGGTNVTIHVSGSVIAESELVEVVKRALVRGGIRNSGTGLR